MINYFGQVSIRNPAVKIAATFFFPCWSFKLGVSAENISTVKIFQISLICKGISALEKRIWISYQPVTSIQWHKMNGNGRLMKIRKFDFGILKVHVL